MFNLINSIDFCFDASIIFKHVGTGATKKNWESCGILKKKTKQKKQKTKNNNLEL